ncbi:MAG: helix-turn-helix domain-containing protein [Cyclobacteriaceae bacterium]|nr:helix-turn-helix domain-containing protein [Cyclobacteriaceae bacterium]
MNKIELEIPESVYLKLGDVIDRTVQQAIHKHFESKAAQPVLYSRAETAAMLKVSLPTLHNYEMNGSLIPQRTGRKVVYTKKAIDDFLNRGSDL